MTRSIKYLMLLVFTVVMLQTVSCYTQIALSPRSTITRDRDEQYEYWERNHRHIRYYYPDCFDCYPWDYYYYSPYWYDYDYYHYYDNRDRYSDDETVREIPSRRETLPGRRGTAAEIPASTGTTTHYYRDSNSSRSSSNSSSNSSSGSISSSTTSRTRGNEDNSDEDNDDNNEDKTRSIPSRRTR